MKRLAFFTSARSDFGLLRPLIDLATRQADVHLLVGGSHYARSRGLTMHEVVEFMQPRPGKVIPVEFLLDGESSTAQAKSLALGQAAIAQILALETYDALIMLGDRWELFAASLPAFLAGIPLVHISGGEVTEGVIDDSVRHAHSKLAHLHFVATETYADNLSRMGEENWRITISGECGLDNIHQQNVATHAEIHAQYGIDLAQKCLLVTFHATTLETETTADDQVTGLLAALHRSGDVPIVFTAPGVEQGADLIQSRLLEFVQQHPRAVFVPHFGSRNYLAVLRAAGAVVGNSSSGVVEAASFGVPAVNIGTRQRHRLAAASVLHVGYEADGIYAAIQQALTPEFQAFSQTCGNPYDPYRDGRNSERIAHAVFTALRTYTKSQLLSKRFNTEVQPAMWNTLLKDFR